MLINKKKSQEIQHFLSSAKLIELFFLFINVKMPTVVGILTFMNRKRGWCDGAGVTSIAGASYNLDYSRARAYSACSTCGWGLFGHFYFHLSFLSSFSLSLGDGPI